MIYPGAVPRLAFGRYAGDAAEIPGYGKIGFHEADSQSSLTTQKNIPPLFPRFIAVSVDVSDP